MSSIASTHEIALSTATGMIDNLVKKGMLLRDIDPLDCRVVICKLSPEGQQLTNSLWTLGQSGMERLLDGLTLEQLTKVAEVTEFFLSLVMYQERISNPVIFLTVTEQV